MLFTKKNAQGAPPASVSTPNAGQGPLREQGSPSEARGPKAERSSGSTQGASILNPHLSFEGNLKYTGGLTIDCEFKGSILTDDRLVIGPSAVVTAEISAGVVEISGKLHGNVRAKSRVRIMAGGQVCGNIETPTLSMEEGVVFDGNCTRPAVALPSAAPQQPPASTSKVPARPREGVSTVPKGEIAAKCETAV